MIGFVDDHKALALKYWRLASDGGHKLARYYLDHINAREWDDAPWCVECIVPLVPLVTGPNGYPANILAKRSASQIVQLCDVSPHFTFALLISWIRY